MDAALGSGYARSWAADFHVSKLGGRTVDEALKDGEDTLVVWRAVYETLGLDPVHR